MTVGVSLGLAPGKWAGAARVLDAIVDGVGRENKPGTGFEMEVFGTFMSFSILHCGTALLIALTSFFSALYILPESRFAPQAGGNVRKEEHDDCPRGSESERTTELVIKKSIAKRVARPKYASLEFQGIFLVEMGKDNAIAEPNE